MELRHGLSVVIGAFLVARCGFHVGLPGAGGPIGPGTAERWRQVPQEEPILTTRLPEHFRAGTKLPVAQVAAYEVRRFRRAKSRQFANESVVPLQEDARRKRKAKLTRDIDRLRPPARVRHVEQLWNPADTIPGDRPVLSVSREILASSAMSHIWVSEVDRYLFCSAPGVASRTWIAFMRKRAGASDFNDINADPLTGPNRISRLVDYSDRDKERLLTRTDFKRVVFVRNPYSRAATTFINATHDVELDSNDYKLFMSHVRGELPNENGREVAFLNFPFFLNYLAKQRDHHRMHPLFAPQTEICGVPGIFYDLKARYEKFDDEVDRVLEALGLPRADFPSANSLGVKVFPSDDGKVLNLLKEAKHRNRIAKLYAEDFQSLGYDRTRVDI